MFALFNRFEIKMTLSQAESCSHSGRCDDDVLSLSRSLNRQIAKISPADIAADLKEYGAWDETELQDHDQNIQRILWIAACNISEKIHDKNKHCKR